MWTFITDLPLPPPHSTHFWATPHSFSVNGFTDKASFHTFLVLLLLANIEAKHRFLCRQTPHSTHILHHFDFYPQITPSLTNFTPTQFHTIFQFSTQHSTLNSVRACYSTFWASRPLSGHVVCTDDVGRCEADKGVFFTIS